GFDGDLFRLALNGRFFSIPRGDLARLIFREIDAETRFSTSVEGVREDAGGMEVHFNHGPPERFDLVIGADGLRSHVRECVFGPEKSYEKYLGYYAASFITQGYPHRDGAARLRKAEIGLLVAMGIALRDEGGGVVTQIFLVGFLRAENAFAHMRAQTVGADYEVESFR